jgi:DNA helicase-2/ATP-dependent DNA helicase PcrA
MGLHSNETVLVIGDSKKASLRHGYAQSVNGLDVVEPVDLPDITSFASRLDSLCGLELVECILTGASTLMTNVESNTTLRRVQTILAGRNRTPASPVEQSLVNLVQDNSRMRILDALVQIEEKPGTKLYRRAAFHALKESIELTLSSSTLTFREAATRVREQRRHIGDRRISKRAIGSTLLLKGLECDHSIILDAGEMNAQNLYVALSRGAKSIAVFAKNNLVGGS